MTGWGPLSRNRELPDRGGLAIALLRCAFYGWNLIGLNNKESL